MITLPMLNTTTSASASVATNGDITASGQSILPAGLTAETGADGKAAPAFLQLLGDRLMTLVKQQAASGASVTGTTDEGKAVALTAEASDKADISSDLNHLLATLDSPEALSALLKPKATSDAAKASSSDETSSTEPVAALSSSDMQALQALFAMLPHNAVQPVTAQTQAQNLSSDISSALATDAASAKGNGQGVLAQLLSASSGQKESSSGQVDSKTDAKTTLKTDSTTALTPASVQSSQSDAGDATKSASFQQVLNSMAKNDDKENSSSAQNATITNTVMSAANAAQTPTATTLVTAPATPQLNAQLGSQEWQQALGQQVLMFSRNGQHSAELRLHPEDLGSIQISLQMNNDQANLNMVSGHSQVRAALEAAIPHLRHALAESGINLGQSNVSSDAFAQNQASGGQQEQRNNNRGNTFSLTQENESDLVSVAVPASLQGRAAGSGAVDIFA